MASIPAPYDPNNWTDPLESAWDPEHFVLADIDLIPSFPTGLVEITPDSYEAHGSEVPINYRAYQVRTFVMRSPDSRAALVRLNGDYLDRAMVEGYLKDHARYVDGVIIRELGLLGAALYEVVSAFRDAPNVRSMLCPLSLLHDGFDLPARSAVGGLQPDHPFLQLVSTIELRSDAPDWIDLMAAETPMGKFLERWRFLKASVPEWISHGMIPAGLSTFSDIEGDGNYQLRPIPLRGRSAHAVGRSRSMSHSDIYLLTDPRGDVCMMAVNALDAVHSHEEEESGFMRALRCRYEKMSGYVTKNMHSDWAFFDGMLLEIAQGLLLEKRSRGNVAWHLPELPSVTHQDRDVASPFVLDCAIFEHKAFGLDLLQLIREG